MSCLPTDKAWKQDFYNNTDCDIYMLINQHQENGVIYPYYGELPLSMIMLTVIYKAAHGLPVGFIIFYHTAQKSIAATVFMFMLFMPTP